MKLIFGLTWVMFLGSQVWAQDFKVLSSQGNNNFKGSKNRVWAGSSLKTSDVIEVGSNSYLGLMHIKTGKTIEIKKSGTYPMGSLVPKVGNSSLVAKYGNFVGEEMVKVEKQNINKNHRKYMAVTGAVTRERTLGGSSKTITLLSQDKETLFNPVLNLNWITEDNGEKIKYYIIVSNLNSEQVAWYETEENKISIDLSNLKRAKDNELDFVITISNANNANHKSVLNVSVLGKNEANQIQKEIGDFKPENPLDYLLLAKFFEDKKLNLDALTCYQKALSLQKSNDYEIAYKEFLVRNKMGYTYEGE
jgi:hypothetical protein